MDINKEVRHIQVTFIYILTIIVLCTSVFAKGLTVSEDFKVSIESISQGKVNASLRNFVGSEKCSMEYMANEYDFAESDIEIATSETQTMLDESEQELDISNATMKALQDCKRSLKLFTIYQVLQVYAYIYG